MIAPSLLSGEKTVRVCGLRNKQRARRCRRRRTSSALAFFQLSLEVFQLLKVFFSLQKKRGGGGKAPTWAGRHAASGLHRDRDRAIEQFEQCSHLVSQDLVLFAPMRAVQTVKSHVRSQRVHQLNQRPGRVHRVGLGHPHRLAVRLRRTVRGQSAGAAPVGGRPVSSRSAARSRRRCRSKSSGAPAPPQRIPATQTHPQIELLQ